MAKTKKQKRSPSPVPSPPPASRPQPSLSLLHIGSDVLSAILCFLPFSDKLVHLTHVTRAFPALLPLHFADNEVKVGKKVVDALYSSSKLLSLLAQSRAVLMSTGALQGSTQRALSLFQPQLGGLLVFPALQMLTFRLFTSKAIDRHHLQTLMDGVFRHVTPFAQLHTLEFYRKSQHVWRFALSPLLNLPALRRVKLNGIPLMVETLSMLCSLQVETLDLEGSTLTPSPEEDDDEDLTDYLIREKVAHTTHPSRIHSKAHTLARPHLYATDGRCDVPLFPLCCRSAPRGGI